MYIYSEIERESVVKKAIYYEDGKGHKPAKEFIDSFDPKVRGKILARITFLGEHWQEMGRPLVDYIGDKIYELRIQFSPHNVRIFYAYMFKDHIVLLHGIDKRTSRVPEADKLKAKKRMIDFQIRYKEGKIRLKR